MAGQIRIGDIDWPEREWEVWKSRYASESGEWKAWHPALDGMGLLDYRHPSLEAALDAVAIHENLNADRLREWRHAR